MRSTALRGSEVDDTVRGNTASNKPANQPRHVPLCSLLCSYPWHVLHEDGQGLLCSVPQAAVILHDTVVLEILQQLNFTLQGTHFLWMLKEKIRLQPQEIYNSLRFGVSVPSKYISACSSLAQTYCLIYNTDIVELPNLGRILAPTSHIKSE